MPGVASRPPSPGRLVWPARGRVVRSRSTSAAERSCQRHQGGNMKTTKSRVRIVRGLIVAVLAVCISLGAGSTASAERPDCADRGVPDSKISIQLWTFAEYIGFGTDAGDDRRTEEVFSRLSEMGYRNVEPFTLSGLTRGGVPRPARQVRAQGVRAGTSTSGRRRTRSTSTRSWRTTGRWGSSSSAPGRPRSSRRSTPPRPSGSPTPSTSTRSAPWPGSRARR